MQNLVPGSVGRRTLLLKHEKNKKYIETRKTENGKQSWAPFWRVELYITNAFAAVKTTLD